jgi:hypothetical protein
MKKIVIIYSYFESPSSIFNLTFFSKKELSFKEDIDYIIVINGEVCSVNLPILQNLKIIKRENTGYDFGAHSVALDTLKTENKTYDYYFFMNSGVIGPIIPHYLTDIMSQIHWSSFFTNKINDNVKLVGTTIVCLPHHDLGGYGPKVEGFFFCTDNIGLKLLEDEKTVFCIHKDKVDTIVNGEYGLSNCILKNGYSIDCMLHRYQNIDWKDKNNWTLNDNKHPSRHKSFYGQSIDPYEVIFHKWFWHGNPTVNFENVEKYISDCKI